RRRYGCSTGTRGATPRPGRLPTCKESRSFSKRVPCWGICGWKDISRLETHSSIPVGPRRLQWRHPNRSMPPLSRVEFLVEEPSTEAALDHLLPKILGVDLAFRIYPHQGKRDLLKKLPSRLRGYRRWLPEDWGIVILIDADG